MIVARLPKMKKSYHSIIVPAVDAAMTRQIPAGDLSGSKRVDPACLSGMAAIGAERCVAGNRRARFDGQTMTGTQPTRSIDLNADIGEYTGTSGAALDDSILDLVSSASIACGGHAGDLEVMQRTVSSAASRGVAIGAHPSYPDRENFGRREMAISEEELGGQLVSQIEALADCCARAGVKLRYVKPHGALYNVAARDAAVARVIAEAVRSVDR